MSKKIPSIMTVRLQRLNEASPNRGSAARESKTREISHNQIVQMMNPMVMKMKIVTQARMPPIRGIIES